MVDGAERKTEAVKGLIAPLVLFLAAMAVYTVSPYPDFFRDEDYEMGYQAASFFWSLVPDVENMGLLDSLMYQASMFGHTLLFYRHGAVPAIYVGLFYALFDALSLPFSAKLLGLPTAILGALASTLFYRILRQADVKPWLAFAGALVLVLSPLFAGLSRGFATFIWVGPIFSLLLCIYALQRLGPGKGSQYFLAFAIINLMLSDALFFLALAAMAVAYGLRNAEFGLGLARPGVLLNELMKGLRPIFRMRVMLPVGAVLVVLIASALFVVKFAAAFAQTIPLNSLLLATGKHSSFGLEGMVLDSHWLTYPSVLLGELAPLALVLALASLAWPAPKTNKAFLWLFTAVAGLGYGVLIYVIKAPGTDVTHGYQIYTLIPLVLLLVLAADRLSGVGVRAERWAKGLALVFLIGAGASCGAYVFKLPLAYSAEFKAEVFGVSKPDYGTKASGHISREVIEYTLRHNGDAEITVDIFRDAGRPYPPLNYGGFRVYTAPYRVNAGILQDGALFADRLNVRPNIKTTIMGTEDDGTSVTRPPCPAEFCVTITAAGQKTAGVYDIVDGEDHLARLFIAANAPADLAPGRYQARDLNRQFDAANTRIEDFYPPRTPEKKLRIIATLKRRLGL